MTKKANKLMLSAWIIISTFLSLSLVCNSCPVPDYDTTSDSNFEVNAVIKRDDIKAPLQRNTITLRNSEPVEICFVYAFPVDKSLTSANDRLQLNGKMIYPQCYEKSQKEGGVCLTFDAVDVSASGVYTYAIAHNGSTTYSIDFYVTVLEKAREHNITIRLGDRLILNCSGVGPGIEWDFRGHFYSLEAILQKTRVTLSDQGVYRCYTSSFYEDYAYDTFVVNVVSKGNVENVTIEPTDSPTQTPPTADGPTADRQPTDGFIAALLGCIGLFLFVLIAVVVMAVQCQRLKRARLERVVGVIRAEELETANVDVIRAEEQTEELETANVDVIRAEEQTEKTANHAEEWTKESANEKRIEGIEIDIMNLTEVLDAIQNRNPETTNPAAVQDNNASAEATYPEAVQDNNASAEATYPEAVQGQHHDNASANCQKETSL